MKESPFDFTALKEIGKDINADHEQLKLGKSYDEPGNTTFCRFTKSKFLSVNSFASERNIQQ